MFSGIGWVVKALNKDNEKPDFQWSRSVKIRLRGVEAKGVLA